MFVASIRWSACSLSYAVRRVVNAERTRTSCVRSFFSSSCCVFLLTSTVTCGASPIRPSMTLVVLASLGARLPSTQRSQTRQIVRGAVDQPAPTRSIRRLGPRRFLEQHAGARTALGDCCSSSPCDSSVACPGACGRLWGATKIEDPHPRSGFERRSEGRKQDIHFRESHRACISFHCRGHSATMSDLSSPKRECTKAHLTSCTQAQRTQLHHSTASVVTHSTKTSAEALVLACGGVLCFVPRVCYRRPFPPPPPPPLSPTPSPPPPPPPPRHAPTLTDSCPSTDSVREQQIQDRIKRQKKVFTNWVNYKLSNRFVVALGLGRAETPSQCWVLSSTCRVNRKTTTPCRSTPTLIMSDCTRAACRHGSHRSVYHCPRLVSSVVHPVRSPPFAHMTHLTLSDDNIMVTDLFEDLKDGGCGGGAA